MACIMRKPVLKRFLPFCNSKPLKNGSGPNLAVSQLDHEIHLSTISMNAYLRRGDNYSITSHDIISSSYKFRQGDQLSIYGHLFNRTCDQKIVQLRAEDKLFLGNAMINANWNQILPTGTLKNDKTEVLIWTNPIWNFSKLNSNKNTGFLCTYSEHFLLNRIDSVSTEKILIYSGQMDYDLDMVMNVCFKARHSGATVTIVVQNPSDAVMLQSSLLQHNLNTITHVQVSETTTKTHYDKIVILGPCTKTGLRCQFGMSRMNHGYLENVTRNLLQVISQATSKLCYNGKIYLSLESVLPQETVKLTKHITTAFRLKILDEQFFDPRRFCEIHQALNCPISKFRDRAHKFGSMWNYRNTIDDNSENDANGHYIVIFEK